MPVKVIAQIEDLRESRSGGEFFVPRSIVLLRPKQIFDTVVQAPAGGVATRQKSQNSPSRLRWSAGGGHETLLLIAFAALTPTAVKILNRADPFQSPLDVRFTIAYAGRSQSTQGQEGAVDIVDTPASVPTSIFFLRANQVLHASFDGGVGAIIPVGA